MFWLRETHPEVSVFWIHASTAERFRQAYASIAEECQVPGYDDPKADPLPLVKRWLERKASGRWLMVIDNADDTQVFFGQQQQMGPAGGSGASSGPDDGNLGRYIPECPHGAILVTTRNLQTGSRLTKGKHLVELGKMGDDETAWLLRARLDGMAVTADQSSALSSRLEHLPLALAQAAAFIQENSITIDEYLGLMDKSDQHLVDLLSEEFETDGRDSETPRAVAETWILSFEQIRRQNAFAARLLSVMSLFDRQAIPLEFLSRYSKLQDEEQMGEIELTKALGVLKAFCFVVGDKEHGFDMHRLVQLVTQKWLERQGTIRRLAGQALLVASQAYPDGNDFKNRATCSAYLPHVHAVLNLDGSGTKEESLARASLLHSAAGLFHYQYLWKDAERFWEQAAEIQSALLGEEHPDTLTSLNGLAMIYRDQRRWKAAEALDLRVMEMRRRVLGEEHPDTLASVISLTAVLIRQERWKEAEALGVQAIEMTKRVLGEEHPGTLTSLSSQATIYLNQQRLKEAEALYLQVVEPEKRVLGEEHPETLTSLSNLACIYLHQRRLKEAEALFLQVVETKKRVLGDEHPRTLVTMKNLSMLFREQGRLKEAEALYRQAMEKEMRVLGEEDPSTLASMHNLAFILEDQGRLGEAFELMHKCFHLRERVLGADHPGTICSFENMTRWWNELQRNRKTGTKMEIARSSKIDN